MRKNVWNNYSEEEKQALFSFGDEYKTYLNNGKTERECVSQMVKEAEAAGYRRLEDFIAAGKAPAPGDKIYAVQMGKLLVMYHIGEEPMEKGMNIVGAHIDSPRIDVKQNPLYEKEGLGYFDTHYYGGIKKYQWVTTPMAIHGIAVKKDGTAVNVSTGDGENDPVFVFTDLLPHLAQSQMSKNAAQAVTGENLDLLIAGMPLKDCEEKDGPVKSAVLALLKEEYGLEEEDLISSELEIVPAGKAKDCGFDRSMVLAYGQDDKVCAFGAFKAMLAHKTSARTACCLLVDKEEIGSVGATSMGSRYFEDITAELIHLGGGTEVHCRRAMRNSDMLSADVSAAFDPLYADVFEANNACYAGGGFCFNKYTGARGKSGSNDANAEYIAKLRGVLDEAKVYYQFSELGKVDEGGGGTIAYITANYGMNVIDCGVPVLNMHAPFEVTSKADLYEAFKGYAAFMSSGK